MKKKKFISPALYILPITSYLFHASICKTSLNIKLNYIAKHLRQVIVKHQVLSW